MEASESLINEADETISSSVFAMMTIIKISRKFDFDVNESAFSSSFAST